MQSCQLDTYFVNNVLILFNRKPLEKIKQKSNSWMWINFFQMNTVGREGKRGHPWQQLLSVPHLPKLENHFASAGNKWIKRYENIFVKHFHHGKEDDAKVFFPVKNTCLYPQGKRVAP